MSIAEAAWLAGFFDGEGSLFPYTGDNGRGKRYLGWGMSISNTNHASLQQCQSFTGSGSVVPKPVPPSNKPHWIWLVRRQRDIASIARQLRPYLVVKADAVDDFFARRQDIEPTVGEVGLEPTKLLRT